MTDEPGAPNSGRSEASDAELLDLVRAGDAGAFALLYRRHSDAAFRVARRNARQDTDAQDIAADAFAQTYSAIMNGAGPTDAFLPYLMTAVRNAAASSARKVARAVPTEDELVLDDPTPGADEPTYTAEESLELTAMLATLPPRWQFVLWRLEVEGKTPREVADEWGMKPNAVSALAVRARSGLRLAYLSAQMAAPSSELPKVCRDTRPELPALVRQTLSARKSRQALEHVAGCQECAAVLNDLEETNSRLGALAMPLVLIGIAQCRFGQLWGSSDAAKAAVVSSGVAAGAAAVYGVVALTSGPAPAQQEPATVSGQVVIADVSQDDGVRRTYEVTMPATGRESARLSLTMPEGVDFLGTYSEGVMCTGQPPEVTCDVGLSGREQRSWRFTARAEQLPDELPAVSVAQGSPESGDGQD